MHQNVNEQQRVPSLLSQIVAPLVERAARLLIYGCDEVVHERRRDDGVRQAKVDAVDVCEALAELSIVLILDDAPVGLEVEHLARNLATGGVEARRGDGARDGQGARCVRRGSDAAVICTDVSAHQRRIADGYASLRLGKLGSGDGLAGLTERVRGEAVERRLGVVCSDGGGARSEEVEELGAGVEGCGAGVCVWC